MLLLLLFMPFVCMAQIPSLSPTTYNICPNPQTGALEYELSTRIPDILGELDPEFYTVEFFATEADASTAANPLPMQYVWVNQYDNSIYVRVTETATGDFATAILEIGALAPPEAFTPPNLIIYEDDFDGITAFNLEPQLMLISLADNVDVTLYITEEDALNQENPIDVSQPFTNTANPQTIWTVAVNTSSGCAVLSHFDLFVGEGEEPVLSFADIAFKNKLLESDLDSEVATSTIGYNIKIDANDDGEIQVSEAEFVSRLTFNGSDIVSIEGVEGFPNLEWLVFSQTSVTAVEFSEMTSLKLLAFTFSSVTSVDLSMLVSLETLQCPSNHLTSLTNLPPNLTYLDCGNNPLETLDLTGVDKLQDFICYDTALSTLTFADKPYLEGMTIGFAPLTSVHFENLVSLKYVALEYTPVTEIDFSGVPSLEVAEITNNEQLTSINLKNGTLLASPELWKFSANPALAYICVDQDEQELLLDYMELTGLNPDIYMDTFCDGNLLPIEGVISFDAGSNGCASGSALNSFVSVGVTGGSQDGFAFTNNSGAYRFTAAPGNYILTPQFENDWFTAIPEFAAITLVSGDQPSNQDFCLSPNGVHPDVEVVIVPTVPAQPGFDAEYKIVYKNKGNQVLSGQVAFTYDEAVTDFILAAPVTGTASAGYLSWNYAGLTPFESREILVTFNVNGPMETPAVNIGDELGFAVSVSPSEADEVPTDNMFDLKQEVIGSFDPNDIACLEGETVTPDMIGEYLHYNINFENTGTAPATFIVVKDVINPEQFDISTLQVIDASHDMTVKVEGNTVEFRFDAIDLGPLEKGNVLFKVKTLGTLQVNDEVSNYADIFFDYNFPITTNDATSTFQVLGTDGFTQDNSVKVYPNPSKGIVTVSADSTLTSVALYDLQGRLLYTAMPNHTETILNIADRAAGVYFIKVTSEKGSKVEKIIKE